ncbi:intracellular protein transport protein USO1 [Nasonia vitripennis]|uniref:Uncharacterized protein n=1 Tax=Nasonia vitripennis TaxID=7425 RepID=A0A7M7QNL8_NASVI|nr:intracellular protein transport protein USO1 [Nasonia vitripennis]
MLHFIYYVILLKYQEELDSKNQKFSDMKSTIHELEYAKNGLERQCCNLQNKNDKVYEENDKLRSSYEKSCKALDSEKEQIERLYIEINDLKYQLQTYKFDFNIIEEEMKKMGMRELSVKNFKSELEAMRLKNERYKKTVEELKLDKNCLTKKLSDLKVQIEKYKSKITQHENELSSAKEKIEELENELRNAECQIYIMNLYLLDQKNYQKENEFLKIKLDAMRTKLDSAKIEVKCLQQELRIACAESMEMQIRYTKTLKDFCDHAVERKHLEPLEQSENAACHRSKVKKNDEFEEISKFKKKLKDTEEELSAKTEALSVVQAKFNTCSSKFESSEKRYKDEIMLLEKKLTCLNQKFQTCTEKNVELLRQNKSLEENYNKCMTELEDIVLQLEDMQSSIVELRTECDTKTQSLDCLSTELTKMKVSRSEVCEETKYVLGWVRIWMKEQKRTACTLQERLRDKQQQLSHISNEKRNYTTSIKRLKRANMTLRKRLKFIRKPATKQAAVVCNGHALASQQEKSFAKRNDGNYKISEPVASYYHFKKEYREKHNGIIEKSSTKGHYKWYPGLKYLSNQIPKISQVNKSIQLARQTHEDTTDGGYITSSAR